MNRQIIIGDIHGCFDEFEALLKDIGITDEDEIISLGDIVDRGPKSVALYEYFKNKENAKVIIGNHERKHINGVLSYAQEIVKIQFGEKYEEFKNWLKTLDYYYETESAIIVHAYYEHDKSLKEQREDVLCGSTSGSKYLEKKYGEENWTDKYAGEKPIIYGHHVVGENPKIENKTYGLDTGACHGGNLTALELPSFKIHQIKVASDYWAIERKKWQIAVLEAKEWDKMTFDKIESEISKLEYIEDAKVQHYLKEKKEWIEKCFLRIEGLREKLEAKCKEIVDEYGNKDFNLQASTYPYKVSLFRIKSKNFPLEELKDQLNTPEKIKILENQLK